MNPDKKDDFLGKVIDKLFSLKKSTLYLALIVLIGFILRIINVINPPDSADAMHFVTHAINFLSADRLIAYDQSSGLWFVLTSIFYKIFGVTQFSARLASLIFGTMTIVIVYLLSKEFFNEKISLISAFLIATAPFHIRSTLAEMDVTAMFFALAGLLFFIKGLKEDTKYKNYIISGVFFGLAIYTKVYPFFFLPSMFLYSIYYRIKQGKKAVSLPFLKKFFVLLIFVFIFCIPAITHNYLLYKDKGFMDLQFTRTFGLGENVSSQFYSFDPIFGEKNDWKGFILGNSKHGGEDTSPLFIVIMKFLFNLTPIIFVLGIFGLLISAFTKRYKNIYSVFFISSIILILPYLGTIILLAKHYLFFEILIIPLAAFSISIFSENLNKVMKKETLKSILLILLLFTIIFLGTPIPGTFPHYYGENYMAQVIKFKDKNIPQDSLIVADSRIYRGQINWMMYGRPYLEASEFAQLVNKQQNLSGKTFNVDVFYVECVYQDCGWGTISGQQEFNNTMIGITNFFKEKAQLVASISEPNRKSVYYPILSSDKRTEAIRIYKINLPINENILRLSLQPRNWFLYYIGYPDPSAEFDYYNTPTAPATLLNSLAHLIVKIAAILSFLTIIFVIYLLYKNEERP